MENFKKLPYLQPKVEISEFAVEDVITTSTLDNDVSDGWDDIEGGWM